MRQGLIQVYTGEGKGKTTAAVGLAVRALGQGLRVLLVRFLKPDDPPSGEVLFLDGSPGLEILSSGIGIIGPAPDPTAVAQSVAETFAAARARVLSGSFDLVVLDEINNVVHRHFLPLEEVLALLEEKPAAVELVLTGRNAAAAVLARADLVTTMDKGKHPFAVGIGARRGIEY